MDEAAVRDGALAPGTAFGKYRIVRLVGAGGMGAVYEAVHSELDKRVAIKVLLRTAATSEDVKARFLREARATARIRHPHVVDVHDVDVHDGVPFMVMEYLEGEDLGRCFDRRGAMPVDELVDLMLPVLTAVASGHEAGVIHRDIKPQNIFLERGAHGAVTPKLLDFGISKLVEPDSDGRTATGTGAAFGTAAYLSPERAMGAKHGGAPSDQYALGLVVYEGVTGQRAHQDDNILALIRQISDGRLTPPRQHRPELSVQLEQVLLRALSLRPEDRYPSIYELAQALLPFASERARMVWTETLARASEGGSARPGEVGSQAAPAQPPPTRLLNPAATGAPATTLHTFASEMRGPEPVARARRRWLLAIAIGGMAIGATAVLLIGRGKPAEIPAGAVAPPPGVAASAPPPAAAPLPAPAPPAAAAVTPAPATGEAEKSAARPGTGIKARPRRAAPAAAKPKKGANNALIIQ